jgi:lysophospholipase L1-like esterase
MTNILKDNDIVLFQGDSVTDAGRDYNNDANLGCGYPNTIASWLTALHPEKKVKFINRGISGNRVKDLQARWQKDCIDLKPDIVSILIGINDTWRRYDSNDPTSTADFEKGYRDLLGRIRKDLNAKIILCEPLLLHVQAGQDKWREDLNPKIDVVRKLAIEYDAVLVPLDGIFAQAATVQPPTVWTADGVHPTQAGHALVAQAWLKSIKAL